jgi:hypothetical protein
MPNELNDLSNHVLSHWLPTGKSSHACRCGQEDRAMKEVWEGQGPAKCGCDLAHGMTR